MITKPSGTQKMTRRIRGKMVPVLQTEGRVRLRYKTYHYRKGRLAPAFYVGWQPGTEEVSGFPLYTLIENIPGHPQWSTVSGKTLEDAGYRLPSRMIGDQLFM